MARTKIKQDFIKRLETFNEQMTRIGRVPRTELLGCEITRLPERAAAHFDLPAGGKYVYLYRRRFADDEPIVTVETYLPCPQCEFALDHDFEKDSLYDVLATSERTRIYRVNRVLEAVAANSKDVETLNIRPGKPIQFSVTIGYNRNDEPIEYSLARYRGDRNRFEVDLLIDTGV